ncbi:MAG: MaoC family dehydratase N-terminal domain-containing protein, partial [bacterium]|nr:MaoC family dehydratase N-terminal domain-containing protein [bacterium]
MSEETTDGQAAALIGRLRREVGATGTPTTARDPVNQPMIRHWCDAMDDANPLYTDPAAARQGPHGEIVAPPAMLNAWNMTGLLPRPADLEDPASGVYDLLDEAGYEGVVATNCEHVYHRYLKLGDHLGGVVKLVDVSDEKQTALGVGHFVTTETEYHDQHGEHVGSMFFRILKFRPGTGRASDNRDSAAAERPPPPPPPRAPPPPRRRGGGAGGGRPHPPGGPCGP